MTTLRVEGTRVGWSFWLLWVLANVVGFGLGGAIGGAALRFVLFGLIATGVYILPGALFGTLFGVAGGFMQWLALRRHLAQSGWWVLAAASGWTISGALSGALSPLGGTTEYYLMLVGGFVFVAAFAGVGGVTQWLILRGQVVRAGWWVLANLLGLFIGFGVGFPIVVIAFGEMSVVSITLFGAGFGAGYGAIAGLVLVWLLRQPVPGAAKQMATAS